MELIRHLGASVLNMLQGLGRSSLFLLAALAKTPALLLRFKLITQQIYSIGVLTFFIIALASFFVGMVLALQGINTLQRFGAEESVGLLVALSLVRELGPVVTALLFAGRAGTALTAEIGLMKSTEQLTAIEMMAIDPMARIVAPRLLGGFISMPILAMAFSVIGVAGGYLVAVGLMGVDAGAFWSQMQAGTEFGTDILSGIIKSVVFGFVVTWIAVFQGYDCVPTPEGVSRATNRTVVYSSLAVLMLDFIITALTLNNL